jgi:chemotaxis protein histidine kinase CheA
MSISEFDPTHNPGEIAEAQLQQELLSLFAVDTQTYLQCYHQIVQQLQTESWRSDIQEIYRCIHTIKGGAVTVSAERVLQVATAIEDVLSDLRYLEPSPPLPDGRLTQILLEAGELLSGVVAPQSATSTKTIEPILRRLQALHQHVREQFLPTWDEQKYLHQEFAEQGFDLVVLDLEIALERSPNTGRISGALPYTAQQTLAQLRQIGRELNFANGWIDLLEQFDELLNCQQIESWRSYWTQLAQALKQCAKQGGTPVPFTWKDSLSNNSVEDQVELQSPELHIERVANSAAELTIAPNQPSADWVAWPVEPPKEVDQPPHANSFAKVPPASLEETDLANLASFLADVSDDLPEHLPLHNVVWQDQVVDDIEIDDIESDTDLAEPSNFLDAGAFLDHLSAVENIATGFDASFTAFGVVDESLDSLAKQPQGDEWNSPEAPSLDEPTQTVLDAVLDVEERSPSERHQPSETWEKVQIPVPFEKLEQSSQRLIDTLLSARMTQGFYQTLQNQIAQLIALAQESAQYITSLRQIQDDYALLDNLSRIPQGPTPERYRQGYTTINRLLETSLRLSELGAEAEKTSQQTAMSLQNLDHHLLKLQSTVEESRLVPFQNLAFRARAILRDLMTRYGKPAHLVVRGEQTELDVSVARTLEPALLHLIRNAYDHGLETVEERLAQGKSDIGTILLSLERRGNRFQLDVQDDGRGISAAKIQSRAVDLGLPLTNTETSSELLAVICQPGFSSETEISEISGRGVGMDVVATQIDRLGGKFSLDTTVGDGTLFHIQFPVPQMLVSCILLQVGQHTFALPTDTIRSTSLFENLNATLVEATQSPKWIVQSGEEAVSAFDLLAYWQPQSGQRSLPSTAVGVSVLSQETSQALWLVADELIGQVDLLISPLPHPLIAPEGLMGVSLQIDGSLVPVLEVTVLAEKLLTATETDYLFTPATSLELDLPSPEQQATTQPASPILIIDDAALIRRRIESSLSANGYLTHTCVDGLEAWNWLQKHPHPKLIITDIEMPNMDGFTLIDRCRRDGINTPVLVISSRLSEEWSTEAKRLGANDYLTKGFSTVELLNKVKVLLGVASAR